MVHPELIVLPNALQDAHELLSHCLDQLKSDVLSLPATQDKVTTSSLVSES